MRAHMTRKGGLVRETFGTMFTFKEICHKLFMDSFCVTAEARLTAVFEPTFGANETRTSFGNGSSNFGKMLLTLKVGFMVPLR